MINCSSIASDAPPNDSASSPEMHVVFTEDYVGFDKITATAWIGDAITEYQTGNGSTYEEALEAALSAPIITTLRA